MDRSPMVKDRHDPEAASLQQRTDTAQMLAALGFIQQCGTGIFGTRQDAPR
jgi:hypothetical protein